MEESCASGARDDYVNLYEITVVKAKLRDGSGKGHWSGSHQIWKCPVQYSSLEVNCSIVIGEPLSLPIPLSVSPGHPSLKPRSHLLSETVIQGIFIKYLK